MAKENLTVDKILRTKPTLADLFYPAMPSLDEARQNESEEEARKRDIRNQRRKIDWENECKTIENRGPYVDHYPWEEADTTIKSLFFINRNSKHTNISSKQSTHEIRHLHELRICTRTITNIHETRDHETQLTTDFKSSTHDKNPKNH